MGKITHLGPGQDFGRGHFPASAGFSAHNRGPKTPAMPTPKAGAATPMAGDGKHGGGFPMSGTGQLSMRSGGAVPCFAEGGHVKHREVPKFAKGGHVESAKEEAAEVKADVAQDKKMVKKGVGQHEDQLHSGKHATLHLAKGGHVPGLRMRTKRHAAPKSAAAPVNRPPANPVNDATPAEPMAGGVMPYGVEQGGEPDKAGSGQGIPQLKGGGKVRGKR